jgi:hypothetical protein
MTTTRIWIGAGLLVAAVTINSCSSKDQLLQTRDAAADAPSAGSGGFPGTGGGTGAHAAGGGAGHLASGGTAGPGGRGGAGTGGAATGGAGMGGRGGTAGAQVTGSGGHDVSPVVCGVNMCAVGLQCCHGCDGSMTCAGACTGNVCPTDAATDTGLPIPCGGRTCGADEFCCGPPSCGTCTNLLSGAHCPALCGPLDGGADTAAGWIACGSGSCGPLEACVHPPRGGTCTMPDAGACPAGTTLQGGCCLPPDNPQCVTIDRACDGPTVTCSCFSKDPCGAGCAGAIISGRDIACVGA